MQKAKIQFHQPGLQQLQATKMDHIFQMLKKQQEGISSLLRKYQYEEPNEDLNEVFSHKPRQSKQQKQRERHVRKSHSLNKSRSKSNMILPELNYLGKQSQRLAVLLEKRKKKGSHQTIEPAKTSLRKELQQIYKDKKGMREKSLKAEKEKQSLKRNKSIQKSRITSEYTIMNESLGQASQKFQSTEPKLSQSGSKALQSVQSSTLGPDPSDQTIPKPLSINKSLMMVPNSLPEQPSDSQSEDIPISYYERQFKQKLTQQCIQQINYLYFSKNESIKEWSQSLLSMFQKHDKEIVGIRKKMKYLEKFDDKFFAVDIYKNQ